VADAAAERKTDISVGLAAVATAEKAMLPMLKQIEESRPKDLERYEFSLTQAIETTADSLDLAEEDLGKRGSEVEQRQQAQKKAIDTQMTPIEKEGQQAGEARKKVEEDKAAEDATPKRKPPTLLRLGEKLGEKKQ
jgi:hypothetical protein